MKQPRTSALGAIAILALLLVAGVLLTGGVGFARDLLGSSVKMTQDEAIQKATEEAKQNRPEVEILETRVDQVTAELVPASEAWGRSGDSGPMSQYWAPSTSYRVWLVTVRGFFRYADALDSRPEPLNEHVAHEQVFVFDARTGQQMGDSMCPDSCGAPASTPVPGQTPSTAPTASATEATAPTPRSTSLPTATSTPAPTSTIVPTPESSVGVMFVGLKSPVSRGATAYGAVKTMSNTRCTIKVVYGSVPSKAAGLEPKTSDAVGTVTWSWTVAMDAPKGRWPVTVTCGSASATEYFTVQ